MQEHWLVASNDLHRWCRQLIKINFPFDAGPPADASTSTIERTDFVYMGLYSCIRLHVVAV